MKFILILIASVICFCGEGRAATNVEFAKDRVGITSGFNGTDIALFGTTDIEGADIIVTLKGPENTVVMRQKGRVLGTWANVDSLEFRRVPAYYDIAATVEGADLVVKQGVGVDQLDFYAEEGEELEKAKKFRDALIEAMKKKNFFPVKIKPVRKIAKNFFKVTFYLPADVPNGNYTATTYILKGEKVMAQESRNIQVGQVGFNARVYLFAQKHGFFYGVFAIIVALISGWSAFTFLRRD